MWDVSFPSTLSRRSHLLFAGVATHFHKSYAAERVIRASAVRQFWQETFGAAE